MGTDTEVSLAETVHSGNGPYMLLIFKDGGGRMERKESKLKKRMTSEAALILESLFAIGLLYWWLGFEVTVIGTLAVMMGHIVKLSWKK